MALRLDGLPPGADRLVVRLQHGSESFERTMGLSGLGRRRIFSAVPAGPAQVDVQVYTGPDELARRDAVAVEIPLGEEAELALDLSPAPPPGRPVLQIDGGTGPRTHPIWGGPILLSLRELLEEQEPLALRMQINGVEQVLGSFDAGRLVVPIDPHLAPAPLPSVLQVRLTACRGSTLCAEQQLSIEVHRRVWSVALGRMSNNRPARDPVRRLLVVATNEQGLRLIAEDTGTSTVVPLPGPFASAPVIHGDLALVVDGEQVLQAVDLDTGERRWSAALGRGVPGIAVDGDGVVVPVGAELRHYRVADGQVDRRWTGPGTFTSPPLVDERGVIIADATPGLQILGLDGRWSASARTSDVVVAPPVRFQGAVVAVTQAGVLQAFEDTGAPRGPAWDLGGTVVLPVAVLADRLVVAAQRNLHFWDGQSAPTTTNFAAPILGAPAVAAGRVVLGLRDGQVWVLSPDGLPRVLSRLAGPALSPVILPGSALEVVIGQPSGELQRLRAEEEF